MVFTNLFFIYLFLPICLLLYFCAKNVRMRNVILLVFSLLFYIWEEPFWILLLLFSSIFNWFMGIQIDRFRTDSLGRKLTIFSVAANILLLIGFKYFSVMAGLMSEHTFPLGISIYTLHAISYLLDCSRGSIRPQNRYLLFLMYLSLFPQLTAGPVVRYKELETELLRRRITSSDIYEGLIKFIIGLTKTVLIAGNLYPVVRTFFGEGFFALSTLGTWYVLLVFSVQRLFGYGLGDRPDVRFSLPGELRSPLYVPDGNRILAEMVHDSGLVFQRLHVLFSCKETMALPCFFPDLGMYRRMVRRFLERAAVGNILRRFYYSGAEDWGRKAENLARMA